jgi:hypothetical protein
VPNGLTEQDFPHFDYDPATGIGFGVGRSRAPMDHGKARTLIDLDTFAAIGNHPCCFKWDGERVVRYRNEHPKPAQPPRGKSMQAQIDEAKARLAPLEQKIGEMHLMIQAIARKVGIDETYSG